MKYCPICERESNEFNTFGQVVPRPNAQCPFCKTLERHRLVYLVLEKIFKKDKDLNKKSLLHIAPESTFTTKFEAVFKNNYFSADIEEGRAKLQMDITKIEFEEESFDYIYCSHVLEHIEDDYKAIKELSRVLKKNGYAFIQVPVRFHLEHTEEDFNIKDPVVRKKLYGHPDHVRNYGKDFLDRLKTGDWKVEIITKDSILSKKQLDKFCLNTLSAGDVYLCKK